MSPATNPSVFVSNAQEQCLSIYWNETPHYIGYRFLEGEPVISALPVSDYEHQPVAHHLDLSERTLPPANQSVNSGQRNDWLTDYSEQNSQAPVQFSFRRAEDGTAYVQCLLKGRQQLDMVFQPFVHGVWVQATLTTTETITGSYCLQQCLRFTGMYNASWRQAIAYTPFLSEFDMQAMGNPNGTLTYARHREQWLRFPVQYVAYPTNHNLVELREESVDHGLIVRESPSRQLAPASYWEHVAPGAHWEQITAGMYWERTAYISNRHPADCIHADVDFGPLEAGQSRKLTGVIYFMEGSKDDLLALWQKDFQINPLHK